MRTEHRDRGAVLPFVAILLPVLLLMTAFAVDLGRQRSSRRTMQADADIIALDMVRLADGRSSRDIYLDPGTRTALEDSATQNDIDPAQIVEVVWGEVSPDGDFVPHHQPQFPPSDATLVASAVRITASETTDYFFQPGSGDATRSAIASNGENTAGFSIGSFGATLDAERAAFLNSILTPILGDPVGLDALSYQGLALASLGVADLGAELGLLTADAVLNESVGFDEAILAAADVLQRNGDFANANLLRGLITPEIEAMPDITLGDLLATKQGAEGAALGADVNALDLLTTGAFLSQCTDPTDLATCSALNVPNLGLSLPLLEADNTVRIIQGQVEAHGPIGTEARTNQTQVDLGLVLGAQPVGECRPAHLLDLRCLLNGLLVGAVDASVSVTASLKLAQGIGTIADIRCGMPLGLDVRTQTGLYDLDLAVTVKFGRRGILGGLLGPLIGELTFSGTSNQLDAFDLARFEIPNDVFGETVVQTGEGNVGLAGVTLGPTSGTGVLGILGNLGITQTVGSVLTNLVNPLLAELDAGLLGPLTDLLGVNVVGADVTPLEVDCTGAGVRLVG